MSWGCRVPATDLSLLHSLFIDSAKDEVCVALAIVIADKLWKQGIKLSRRECAELLAEIRKNPVSFSLPPGSGGRLRDCQIEIDEIDMESVARALERHEQEVPERFRRMAEGAVSKVLPDMKKRWPKKLREQRREINAFERRLYSKWSAPLDGMRHVLTISAELTAGFRESIDLDNTKPMLWELLTRFCARAIRTAEEIYCLLQSGFADGALARWRTLHEIRVVSAFIMMHGEEAATRYFDYEWVESKKRIDELSSPFWTDCHDGNFLTDRAQLEAGYQAILRKYGSSFRQEYGWAAPFLAPKKANFRELEKLVSADNYRFHYMQASSDVHAGPKGTYASVPYAAPTLLIGPSDKGLSWAGQATVHVLLDIVENMVELHPSLDAIVTVQILQSLVRDLDNAFEACEARLTG